MDTNTTEKPHRAGVPCQYCGKPHAEERDTIRALAGELLDKARNLTDAMETCHICGGIIIVEEMPTHCEDCSWSCDTHDLPDCPGLGFLHLLLKAEIRRADAALKS